MVINISILKSLLSSPTEYISGANLATELNISRVGIWNRLEKLKQQGFEFEAIRHRGYKIVKEPEAIHLQLICAYLELDKTNVSVKHFEDLDSTNSEAERQISLGLNTPFVVIASSQNKGRGRMGRTWHSPQNGNCYLSFAFCPNLPPDRMNSITLWMGVAICQFINDHCQLNAKVKWPNDIIINNKKVGGMLTEARIDSDHTRDLIIGIGINLNSDCSNWPEELSQRATSLSEVKGSNFSINQFASKLIQCGLKAYADFSSDNCQEEFTKLWQRYDILKGKEVVAEHFEKTITGIANGIDETGALLIKVSSGKVVAVRAGEVSLSKGGYTK